MTTTFDTRLPSPLWRSGPSQWLVLALAAGAVVLAFFDPLRFMVATWGAVEEYSYGYFIPFIVAFLVWQRSDRLRQMELRGAWGGLALVALALLLRVVGELSAIRLFAQYGFVVAVFGLSVCAIGWRGTRVIAVPLSMLVFMIPLPQFLLRELSHSMQLISSELGVAMIRAAGISVFLEGNIIDLGSYKLEVVEACNGLRYLFPLMVLGVLSAYLFQGAMWKRLVIIAATVPLTIVINSLRIGLIGITVEHWGREMADGLLHDLEGGFMFLLCMAALIGLMALLARVGRDGRPFRSVFGLDFPLPAPKGVARVRRPLALPAAAAAVMVVAVASWNLLAPAREQVAPSRASFAQFPLELPGGWAGYQDRLQPDVLAILALDDYFLANFVRPGGAPPVNFYSAFYSSQSGGESSHSPRTCIPGAGWSILSLETVEVPVSTGSSTTRLPVNRAVIAKGEQRQLVYYWFQQRGRTLTDEYEVKWWILSDGITRNRSDGALLRLVTPIDPAEGEAAAERRLRDFLAEVEPRITAFVPD